METASFFWLFQPGKDIVDSRKKLLKIKRENIFSGQSDKL
jgi:hypothetical protein